MPGRPGGGEPRSATRLGPRLHAEINGIESARERSLPTIDDQIDGVDAGSVTSVCRAMICENRNSESIFYFLFHTSLFAEKFIHRKRKRRVTGSPFLEIDAVQKIIKGLDCCIAYV